MHQLIYFSSASYPYSKQDLLDILNVSRANNSRDGISGVLLYKDGNIMQVLEGDRELVEKCFERVSSDPRHKGLIVIDRNTTDEREFGDWSMGFRDLSDVDLGSIPGYNPMLNKSMALEDFASDASATKELLRLFATGGI